MTPEQEKASADLRAAEANYLRAFGWEELKSKRWKEPREPWRELMHRHAVNSQLYYERQALDAQRARMAWKDRLASYGLEPPGPGESFGEGQLLWDIRYFFVTRHERPRTPGVSWEHVREDRRHMLRSMIRSWAREHYRHTEPVTRVERARLKRAQHALVHKGEGCECGRKRTL